jgi:hypothetical protein
MVNLIIWLTVFIISCGTGLTAHAFRCGEANQNIVGVGMYKQQILNECGPPYSREVVGLYDSGNTYQIVEEWIYVIDEYGYKHMYLIQFDGNGKAVKIDWIGEQKSVFK